MAPPDDRAAFWTRVLHTESEPDADSVIRATVSDEPARSEALAAWRAHREALRSGAERLDARAREIEALQSFGRGLAEARTVAELLDRAACGIGVLLDPDAVGVAVALTPDPEITLWLARPLGPGDAARLRRQLGGGLLPDDVPVSDERHLPRFDPFQGPRAGFDASDVVTAPVLRRGREVLRIGMLGRTGRTERDLRLMFGVTNHLVVHLERVLAVAESEQGRFRAILDSMPHAVVLVDAAFQVVQANASAERLFGRDGGHGTLRSVGGLDFVSLAYEVLSGRHDEAAAETRLDDGTLLEVTVTPWRNPAGAAQGLVVVLHDVTTSRQLREQVARSERLSGLGRLLAGVAHELNNPLTSVIGYAQLIPSMPPGEALNRRLETVRREAERCRRIVRGLLRFARPHAPDRGAVSLNQVATDVASLLAYSARAQGVTIAVDLDPDTRAILGDVHELEQAVVNLVSNAQHAISGAGRTGTVTLRTRGAEAGLAVLEVEDDGPGVPEALRARVFDPFFSTKPTGQGTGLGLWLVYNTVGSHGGRIDLDASASGGARFRIALPAATASAPADAPHVVPEETPRVSGRILVADPEAALAALICEALAEDGHEVVAARDAEETIALLAGESFDVVVADALFPGLPADRLAATLARRGDAGRSRRLLLTTGDWVGREPEALAQRVGGGLLRKPFEIDELRDAVRRRLTAALEAAPDS